MTEISRSIEIAATAKKVWSCINPNNWTQIFDFVKEVNGYRAGKSGVGTQAKVEAGDKDASVRYNVEITEFQKHKKIVYKRYGGPLTGKGVIELKPLHNGTLFIRTSYYDDDLSEQIIQTLSAGMEKDNRRIKNNAEKKKN